MKVSAVCARINSSLFLMNLWKTKIVPPIGKLVRNARMNFTTFDGLKCFITYIEKESAIA